MERLERDVIAIVARVSGHFQTAELTLGGTTLEGEQMKAVVFAFLLLPTGAFAEAIDFEAVSVGAQPTGWSVAMTSQGGAPRWSIERDPSSPAGEKVLAQLSDDRTSGRFPLAIYDGAEMTDGEISAHFKPISGRVDQAAGLVWRYRDANNYYLVRANALENNVVLYKVENGKRTSLGPVGRRDDYGVKHTVPAQQWSLLKVAFRGSRFTVSFDGEKLYEVEDSTFAAPGKVGFWTKADSVTYFDGLEIKSE
jgi:hypothetical protein